MKSLHRESKSRIGFRSTSRASLVKATVLDTAKNSKCAICLERIQDATYLNPCNHRFCFACIQKWSKKKIMCPLCKQQFHSFFHIVNTKGTFCEYVLPLNDDAFPRSEGRRVHSSASFKRSVSPPDNGIVHGEIRGTISQTEKGIYHLMKQFAKAKGPGDMDVITLGKFKAQAVIQFRRALYHAGIFVQKTHHPDLYQNSSAEYLSRHPHSFDRLIPWLKRELKVLYGNQKSPIHTLQSFILNNMTRHDLQSKEFEDLLRPHLHHFTNHFLHELISFVQSPFTMKKYDWSSLYECPVLPPEESDSSTASAISNDEHSLLTDNDQAHKAGSNFDGGLLGHSQSKTEEDTSSFFAVADGIQCPNEEGNNLEDLTSTGMEKDGHLSDTLPQNQLVKLPSNSAIQSSLLHNQTLPCKNGNEEMGEPHPVQTCSSKNMEPSEDSSNLLVLGDCGVSNFNHGDDAAISTKQNVLKGEAIRLQPSGVCRNNSRGSSSEKGATVPPGSKNVFKKDGSRSTERCLEEGHGRQARARSHCGRRQNTNYARAGDRRPRTEVGGSSIYKDISLLNGTEMILPFRSENPVSGNINKSRYQQSYHLAKLKKKDYNHLRNSFASEPSWRYLYYKQDYERCRYEEFMRQKTREPRFYHPNMLTGSKGRSCFLPENKTSAYLESLTKGWHYLERHRSTGRPKGRYVAAGLERGTCEKIGWKRRRKSYHLESGHAKAGTRYFQDYTE